MVINKKTYSAAKILFSLFCILFIGVKLWNEAQSKELLDAFASINKSNIWIVLIVFIMSILNWSIETQKWRFVIKKLQTLSFIESFKAILTGITVSLFTPNRVGEFGGRILALERRNRIAGVFATLLGGYSQLLVTLIIGIVALPIYIHNFPNQLPLHFKSSYLFYISFVVILLFLFVFIKIKFFARYLESLIKNEKKKRFVHFLTEYTTSELVKILSFSLIRYFVFTTQFFLLLSFFGISISYVDGIICIGLIYFIMTIIPVISMFEFGLRGSVALIVLGVYTPFNLSIISASILLWIINLALPALFGSVLLYKYKI